MTSSARWITTFFVLVLVGCGSRTPLTVGGPDGGRIDGALPDGGGGCHSNDDCTRDPRGHVCDLSTGACVICVTSPDTCGPGTRCDTTHHCVPGCRTSADCMPPTVCDTTSHVCTGCSGDTDCAPGTICRGGMCIGGCSTTHPCGAGSTCCDSHCSNTNDDPLNCGGCGRACATDDACCSGGCANTGTDPLHCSTCTTPCVLAHATPACVASTCEVSSCATGFGDCNHIPSDGCEADLSTDVVNCGGCMRPCAAGPFATPSCVGMACRTTCMAGHGDCDGDIGDGCETDTTTPSNCGGCGTVCPTPPNATATCPGGMVCGYSCTPGSGDCNGVAFDGCETNLGVDTNNCGGCGVRCSLANATAMCTATGCAIATCNPGFTDCNGVASDGCETNTAIDRTNCGTCGHGCALGQVCAAGICGVSCPPPLSLCGTACTDTASDANNCGSCGNACPTGAHAVTICSMHTCGLACLRGFDDCNGSIGDGCETSISDDASNCGTCGHQCIFPHSSGSTCVDSGCQLGACDGGFDDCNGALVDGCEADLTGSVSNCGTCGHVCTAAHATPVCSASACGIGACDAGFGNCDGSVVNGCETSTRTSPLNCGSCGHACMPGEACASGSCVSTCPPSTTFCAGACIDTSADPANCGGCFVTCPVGSTCLASSCTPVAPVNDNPSGAIVIDVSASSSTFAVDTTAATFTRLQPCGGFDMSAKDVYFRFTLTGRELVQADTLGAASYDSVIYFARDSGGTVVDLPMTTTTGDAVCNDDASSLGCGSDGTRSRATALLDAGTYYVVVTGFGGGAGTSSLRFEHLRAATTVRVLPAGASTQTGATTPPSSIATVCGLGDGGEVTFWWASCSTGSPGTFTANTCGGASFDTVLDVKGGTGDGDGCDDDACGGGTTQSRLSAMLGAGSRLHTLQLDGFGSADNGSFTLHVTRP